MDTTDPSTPAEVERAEAHSAHNYHPLPVVIGHGEGAWMTDATARFIDLLAGYSALNSATPPRCSQPRTSSSAS